MAINTHYKVREYDWHADCECFTSVSLSTTRVGTEDDEGLSSAPNTTSFKPGTINDTDAYVRTNLTEYPQFLQDQLAAVWTDNFHTAYEASLRA